MREKNPRSCWLYAFLTVLCAASLAAAPAAEPSSGSEARDETFLCLSDAQMVNPVQL